MVFVTCQLLAISGQHIMGPTPSLHYPSYKYVLTFACVPGPAAVQAQEPQRVARQNP